MRVGADTIVILDHVHERAVNERRTSEVVELGLRRQVPPGWSSPSAAARA